MNAKNKTAFDVSFDKDEQTDDCGLYIAYGRSGKQILQYKIKY
ncbi:Uncharacterised protein [Chryseobacterium carnipullorum]|uniref:Uncharacterized protein n=1 Tax=Chryseobacterium carnipullorum TaxID=1124835 RepID=A0A376E9C5_CHRCU|nr:Uncharacterised protein [Chryseobacterium carnipullorum]